ncbi:MAG: ATP-binding protein [Candidatus Methylumidiphilus sp.]
MKIQIKNLGALKQAEFTLGDMTIICGGNNTGKTYATYALFGFLSSWRDGLAINIPEKYFNRLIAEGVVHINIEEYLIKVPDILAKACEAYTEKLPMVFAASADRFKDSEFKVTIENSEIQVSGSYRRRMKTSNAVIFTITKQEVSTDLVVTLLVEQDKLKIPRKVIIRTIEDALINIIFSRLFPNPFIASAERTGAAIFRKELNFARNRLLEEMSQVEGNINPMDLLLKGYQDYALPVKENVEFTRQLETKAKSSSFIVENHSEVLEDFADIIGGQYSVTRNDELYYIPKGKRVKLTMDESSSAVRSLLDVGFYLKHIAKPGDLLMIDEPELNLHPENQCRVARLFARLVNIGIKVFITTHSDYIIKELNTLIMLNNNEAHLQRIAEQEGYKPEELISSDKIKVYIAEQAMVKLDGGQRKTLCQTLTPADIDPLFGIEARSFDTTIAKMNRIQEAIIWGGE